MFHRKRRETPANNQASSAATTPTNNVTGPDDDNGGEYPSISSSSNPAKQKRGSTASTSRRRGLTGVLLGSTFLLAGVARYLLSTLVFLRIVTLAPVAACLYQGLIGRSSTSYSRMLPLTLVATVVTAQFPTFLGAAVAALGVLFFSLVTLPQNVPVPPSISNNTTTDGNGDSSASQHHQHQQHSKSSPITVLLAVVVCVTVLLTENFMVWVVSATFEPGWRAFTAPPPLQDNGRNMIQYVLRDLTKHQVVSLRRLWNVQWSLVACLGVALFMVQVYRPVRRQLYSIAVRAVTTLAVARFIRTCSFLLTVLPSQNKSCYAQHYPYPPPDDWMDWMAVGLEPASHGGCNDLIISGHATVTATMACVASSVAISCSRCSSTSTSLDTTTSGKSSSSSKSSADYTFATALWIMVALDYCIEIYEGFHYAVDMWLGVVLVSLLWNALAPLEERDYHDDDIDDDDKSTSTSTTLASAGNKPSVGFTGTLKDVGLYSLPTLAAYLQLTVMPQSTANPLIVVFVLFASGLYGLAARKTTTAALVQAYHHYAQHALFCLLFLALGVYL
jgi:hypothetical protein